MVRVYAAGRIHFDDWRTRVYEDAGDWNSEAYSNSMPPFPETPIVGVPAIYTGPYFVRCDHGCFHGPNSHGVGADDNGGCTSIGGDRRRMETFRNCCDAIDRSDIVYAFIEDREAFGTLWELGYAKGRGKTVYIDLKPTFEPIDDDKNRLDQDLWFALEGATRWTRWGNPVEGLKSAVRHFLEFGPY